MHDELIAAVRELRALLARPGNDFTWSGWADADAALAEIDAHLAALALGRVPDLWILLVPTGPAQECAICSGWGDEYCAVASRIEAAFGKLRT